MAVALRAIDEREITLSKRHGTHNAVMQAIKEITAKTKAVKSETADLSRKAAAIREECDDLKKASFAAKDRMAAAQAALKQAEVGDRDFGGCVVGWKITSVV